MGVGVGGGGGAEVQGLGVEAHHSLDDGTEPCT